MSEAWISTRIEKEQRDTIDRLVDSKKYVSRSEFIRTAIKTLLMIDMDLDLKMLASKQGSNSNATPK